MGVSVCLLGVSLGWHGVVGLVVLPEELSSGLAGHKKGTHDFHNKALYKRGVLS